MRTSVLLGQPAGMAVGHGWDRILMDASVGSIGNTEQMKWDQAGTLQAKPCDGGTGLLSSGLSSLLQKAGGEPTFMTHCFFQLWVSFGGVDLDLELWCLWWDRERLGRAGGRDWCSYPCAKGTLLQPHPHPDFLV